jgi:hypothetical protein
MFLALLMYHIYHPGKVLTGPDAEYPRVTKEEKAIKKQQKREDKEGKKRLKQEKNLVASRSALMDRDVEA